MSQLNVIPPMISGVFLLLEINLFVLTVLGVVLVVITTYFFNVLPFYLTDILLIYAFCGIGISQFLYVIPLVISLKQRQEWGLMKRVIIGTVLTVLLNG